MPTPDQQEALDDAMYDFSMAEYETAIRKLLAVLEVDSDYFDARVALGMAFYRLGNYEAAIREGLRAEALRPKEPMVHTNLSLFYMRHGDKQKAEHHGLQARIASWREDGLAPPATGGSVAGTGTSGDPELTMAQPAAPTLKFSGKLPAQHWKKQKPAEAGAKTKGQPKP
jgi:tetratricopeptide (TPR) repeat protein